MKKSKTKTWFSKELNKHKNDFEFILVGVLLDVTGQICDVMTKKKIKRFALAHKMKTSKGYITEILRGKRNMTIHSMLKLSNALGAQLRITIK